MPTDSFFFWSVIVIIALIVMALSARFIMRIALFIVSILAIWYCLSYVGLVEPPQQFFKAYEFKRPEILEPGNPAEKRVRLQRL